MSKTLVLAEKPSVGKELAKALNCKKSGAGYVEGGNYIVTWALGHLVELAGPEYYGEKYKKWDMENLPVLPQKMALQVISETSKQFHTVKTLLQKGDVGQLIIATDAGREGELVARWIIEKVGFHKPIKRLWISSQTEKAIKEGFAHLRDGKEYLNLYRAAVGRAEADWLVGLNITRALTCKYNAQLSAGRVQTPTLAIIVQREEEIKKFRSKKYYNVRAGLEKFSVIWQNENNQTAIDSKEAAEELARSVQGTAFRVAAVTASKKIIPPPMLYDLTELQRDANKLYQMSPKETLNAMQHLYETYKALTYPRTDSRYLTEDIVPTLGERLRAVAKGEFSPLVSEILRGKAAIAKACINNSKVSDHHAIIPTEESVSIASLPTPEKRIYLLVVKRFLACFYPPYEYEQIRAELVSGKERFYATGQVVLKKGFRAVADGAEEEGQEEELENKQTLPPMKKGDVFHCQKVQVAEKQTLPPSRYTEASLLSAMENPSRFIQDKRMKGFIGGGLGTPATRADIIEKLYQSFYIEKKGNSMVPTSKGVQLIQLAPPDLKEPLLTAKWEEQLEQISKGKLQKDKFIQEIKEYAEALVHTVKQSGAQYVHDNATRTPCPQCGKLLLAVNGKKGKLMVCPDRECGYRHNVCLLTNARCPVCHKKLSLYGDGEKRLYVCDTCGFKEKAESFHKRLSAHKGADKKSVEQYMKKQKQQERQEQDISPLALALKKALEEQDK